MHRGRELWPIEEIAPKNTGLFEFSSRYVQAIPNYKTKMIARRACELVYQYFASNDNPHVQLHELTRRDLEGFADKRATALAFTCSSRCTSHEQ